MIKLRNITLQDVADECGVTVQTVSRILNSKLVSLYHRDTIRKVRETALRLGYRPNAFAQFIRSGKFHSVSLLLSPELSYSSFPLDYLVYMERELSQRDYNLLLTVLPEREDVAENKVPRIFRENLVDGVFVCITHAIPDWLESLIKTINVPIVWIGSKHKKDCVHHDDFKASYDATLSFVNRGHRIIAYVDLVINKRHRGPKHFSVKDREDGYRSAMKAAGFKPIVIRSENPISSMDFAKFAKGVLSDRKRVTAFLTYDFSNSGRALLYAAASMGLRIPEDFDLISFNEYPILENSLQISSILPRKSDIISSAVNMLFEKIDKKIAEHSPVVLPFVFYDNKMNLNKKNKEVLV